VPETERNFAPRSLHPRNTKPSLTQGLRSHGARGTRTPDLLGAMQGDCALRIAYLQDFSTCSIPVGGWRVAVDYPRAWGFQALAAFQCLKPSACFSGRRIGWGQNVQSRSVCPAAARGEGTPQVSATMSSGRAPPAWLTKRVLSKVPRVVAILPRVRVGDREIAKFWIAPRYDHRHELTRCAIAKTPWSRRCDATPRLPDIWLVGESRQRY
jgi:hypothetical protein